MHQGTTTVGSQGLGSGSQAAPVEIYDTEQQLLAERNAHRNLLRERNIFFNEGDWPVDREESASREAVRARGRAVQEPSVLGGIQLVPPGTAASCATAIRFRRTPATSCCGSRWTCRRERLEMFFRLEADRMVNAVFAAGRRNAYTVLEQFFVLQRQRDRPVPGSAERRHRARQPDLHPYRRPPTRPRLLESRRHAPHVRGLHRPQQRHADAGRRHDHRRGADAGDHLLRPVARAPEPPARMDVEGEPPPGGSVRLDWMEPIEP